MLRPHHSPGAHVIALPSGFRMEIPAGEAGTFRLAQLDEYMHLPRGQFHSHPPLTLSLRARVSSASHPGTWGFGLWNDPFGLSLGFGGDPFRLPTLPNAVWFFHASQENWLSFGNSRRESESSTFGNKLEAELRDSKPAVGNGFLAQAFRAPRIPSPLLAVAGIPALSLLAARWTRKFLRRLIGFTLREAGVRLAVDPTQWRRYRLEWSPRRCAFWVDEVKVLETPVSPRPPLGLVLWIDNQFARFTPEGEIGFGVLKNDAAWLEVEEMVIRKT